MPRPSAILTATLAANMDLIARSQERDRALAAIQRGAAELFHVVGKVRAEEADFIERVRAENRTLEATKFEAAA